VANQRPPEHYADTPATVTLPSGTVLFRVHQTRFLSEAFNPMPTHRYYGGGRFDSTDDDRYPYMYAGQTVEVAITETLLRDLPIDDTGMRLLPMAKVRGRRISAITTAVDLSLVSLRSAADLGAVAQDTWLTMCDPRDYAQSRHWAHWIRGHETSAAGYAWRSRRDPTDDAYVLFGDRCPAGALQPIAHPDVPLGDEAEFDSVRGRRWLRRQLVQHRVTLTRR
jgi:hypothetical protein